MKSYVGIDWSEEKHDVRVHNEQGEVVVGFQVAHSADGFAALYQRLEKITSSPEETLVAIETAHNLLVDSLWSAGYQLYVVAPSQVKASRPRQRSSAARTDDSDAALLAKIVRMDRERLSLWQPESALIQQLRSKLKLVDTLTAGIVRQGNRLRAMLLRYYPAATVIFGKLIQPIPLHFLAAYPTPAAARALTYKAFSNFCRGHRYPSTHHLPKCYARLCRRFPQADPAIVEAYQENAAWLARQVLSLVQKKKTLLKEVQTLFQRHPDHAIFDSVPGAGEMLAPKLLVIFGDCRERWPSPDDLRALAGTCPVTVSSGNSRFVRFRRACNKEWRHTLQQLARCSLSQSPWAATYFDNALQRGLSENHAYRTLANRWLGIIWTLWTKEVLYDEDTHLRNVHIRRRPQAA